jgi:hypothetical protein
MQLASDSRFFIRFFLERQTSPRIQLTFSEAFKDKKQVLAEMLQVSDDLLHKLREVNLINASELAEMDIIYNENQKSWELLGALERRSSSLFIDFCEILKTCGHLCALKTMLPKGHVVRLEVLPDELEAELEELIEPNYGLLEKLHVAGVIDRDQLAVIYQQKSVHRRVSCLLQAVKRNWGSLKAELFLQTLSETGHRHIVNFIAANGGNASDFGDIWPLNEQQRRRLSYKLYVLEAMNLCGDRMLQILRERNVLSASHVNGVLFKKSREKKFKRLTRILERRSVADLKTFITCLNETRQENVVRGLTEFGAVGRIFSSIATPDMSAEDQVRKQKLFVQRFNKVDAFYSGEVAFKICRCMEKLGYEIIGVKTETRLSWYVMCRTVQSLESLRRWYKSPCNWLAKALQWIFNELCGTAEKLELSVEWNDEDYYCCRSILTATSCGPFESFIQCQEPPYALVGIFVIYASSCLLKPRICQPTILFCQNENYLVVLASSNGHCVCREFCCQCYAFRSC